MKTKFLFALVVAIGLAGLAPSSVNAAVGQACGGFPNLLCGPGEFCQKAPGRCNVIDMAGKCAKIPQVCAKIHKPVCGCDGKTYGNDCQRQAAMVSKNHNGKCK